MRFKRLPVKDPRTVARDIPGICDLLFPQLLSSYVKQFNKTAKSFEICKKIDDELIDKMVSTPAMLFEISFARSEQILRLENENWNSCIDTALKRQMKYFDAELPETFNENDLEIASITASNLVHSLYELKNILRKNIDISPPIIGYKWISKGNGDFAIGNTLIEVKCSNRNFISADYRQILIYWLLSFAGSIENKCNEWESCILLNPRLNKYVELNFTNLIRMIGAGRTKIEILELFSSITSIYSEK